MEAETGMEGREDEMEDERVRVFVLNASPLLDSNEDGTVDILVTGRLESSENESVGIVVRGTPAHASLQVPRGDELDQGDLPDLIEAANRYVKFCLGASGSQEWQDKLFENCQCTRTGCTCSKSKPLRLMLGPDPTTTCATIGLGPCVYAKREFVREHDVVVGASIQYAMGLDGYQETEQQFIRFDIVSPWYAPDVKRWIQKTIHKKGWSLLVAAHDIEPDPVFNFCAQSTIKDVEGAVKGMMRGICAARWVVVPKRCFVPNNRPKSTYCDLEVVCHFDEIYADLKDETLGPFNKMWMDIETETFGGRFSDPEENQVYMIACRVDAVRYARPRPIRKVVFLHSCDLGYMAVAVNRLREVVSPETGEVETVLEKVIEYRPKYGPRRDGLLGVNRALIKPDVEVIECFDEREMLLMYSALVRHDADPDVIATFRGNLFDLPYLHRRAQILGIEDEFLETTRLKNVKFLIENCNRTQAGGSTKSAGMHVCPGRWNYDLQADVLTRVDMQGLPETTLKYLASKYCGKDAQKLEMSFDDFAEKYFGTPDSRAGIVNYNVGDNDAAAGVDMKIKGMDAHIAKMKTLNCFAFAALTQGQNRVLGAGAEQTSRACNNKIPTFQTHAQLLRAMQRECQDRWDKGIEPLELDSHPARRERKRLDLGLPPLDETQLIPEEKFDVFTAAVEAIRNIRNDLASAKVALTVKTLDDFEIKTEESETESDDDSTSDDDDDDEETPRTRAMGGRGNDEDGEDDHRIPENVGSVPFQPWFYRRPFLTPEEVAKIREEKKKKEETTTTSSTTSTTMETIAEEEKKPKHVFDIMRENARTIVRPTKPKTTKRTMLDIAKDRSQTKISAHFVPKKPRVETPEERNLAEKTARMLRPKNRFEARKARRAARKAMKAKAAAAAAKKKKKKTSGGRSKPRFGGGLVLDPVIGHHTLPVPTLDFSGLYPSIITSNNICPTTIIVGGREEAEQEWGLVEKTDFIVLKSGVAYVTPRVKLGMLPQIVDGLVKERRRITKVVMKTPEVINDPALYDAWDGLQKAVKVCANAWYGVNSSSTSRFGCIWNGYSITKEGQTYLLRAKECVEKIFPVMFPEVTFKMIYGDTDSVMFEIDAPWLWKDPETKRKLDVLKALAFLEELEKIMNSDNRFPDGVKMEGECVMFPSVFYSKKLYIGHKLERNKEAACGYKLTEKFQGVAVKRSNTLPFTKTTIKEIYKMILQDNEEPSKILAYVEERLQKLLSGESPIPEVTLGTRMRRAIENYKQTSAAHVMVAKFLEARDAASAPRPNDRIQFVLTKQVDARGRPERSTGKRARPLVCLDEGDVVDYLFVTESQFERPIHKALEHVVPQADIDAMFERHLEKHRRFVDSAEAHAAYEKMFGAAKRARIGGGGDGGGGFGEDDDDEIFGAAGDEDEDDETSQAKELA